MPGTAQRSSVEQCGALGPVDQPETICIGRGGWVMGLKFTVLYRSFREQSSHKCSYFSASFRNQRGLLGDLNNLAHNGVETGTRARVKMMGPGENVISDPRS